MSGRKVGGLFGAFFCCIVAGYFLFSCNLSLGNLNFWVLVGEIRFWIFVFSGVGAFACLTVAFSGDDGKRKVAVQSQAVAEKASVAASTVNSVSSVEAEHGLVWNPLGYYTLKPGSRVLSVTDGPINLPEGGFLYPPKPVQPQNLPVQQGQVVVVPSKERRFFREARQR